MLEGKFDSNTDLTVYSKYINFDFELNDFKLILIKISPSTPLEFTEEIIKKINIYSLHIRNLLQKDCSKHIVYTLSYDRIVVLVKSDINKLVESIKDLRATMPQDIKNLRLNIGISNRCDSIYDIASSYSESQCALIYSMVKKNNFYVFYNDIKNNNNTYYFPVELNSLLINHTSAGNITEMEKIISKLIDENIINRNLSIDMIRLFVSELYSTVIKIRNNMHIDDCTEPLKDIDAKLSSYATLDDIQKLNMCVTLLKSLGHYVKNKKCQYKKNLSGMIKDYIDKNYHNPDLSLYLIADKFNISETYASQLFKEYTNKTYTKYLQSIRLKKANQLLKTDVPIKTILNRIGYNSLNTFERAYKRTYGKTPSAYRRSFIKK
jgi:YesN/AraC family two-component response regulator